MADLIVVHVDPEGEEYLLNRDHVLYARRIDAQSTGVTLRDGHTLLIQETLQVLRDRPARH